MVQDNKEFDKKVKDLLYDAEEEVPAGIMDDVFSRLDNSDRKSVKLPPWLGWTLSGVAVAAAVALFVMLRPSGIDGNIEVRQDLTAESSKSTESSECSESESLNNNMLALADDNNRASEEVGRKPDAKCGSESANASAEDSGVSGSYSKSRSEGRDEVEQSGTPEILKSDEDVESQGSGNDSIATSSDNESLTEIVSESAEEPTTVIDSDLTGGNVRVASADDEDSTSGEDLNSGTDPFAGTGTIADGDPFAELDEDEREKYSPKVSLLAGGDVSTNNEAKGLSGFGGFRIPSLDAKDVTYVEQIGKSSSYSIPLTFGLSAKVNFTKRWAVGAGVNWTMLRRTFNGRYVKVENGVSKSADTEVQHTLQYIGIPVNAFYNIIESPRIKFYTYAGGTVEKGISNVYRVQDIKNVPSVRNSVKGVQLSAGAGLGVEFIVVDWLGIYINPGVRYYFDCDQPVNIRTQQPFMMDFEIGLRVEI